MKYIFFFLLVAVGIMANEADAVSYRGYTGHEHLPEFNLINMNGRLYDPQLGSFLSPDPFVQAPDYSQSFNRYAYCLNNPLKYTDPDGEVWWIAALIGFVTNYVSYGITNGDWGKKAFSQGLIGAGISLVGFGAGYAAMAGAEAIGMSAGLAGLTSGAIGGAVAGGVSAGINGDNIGQGMLAGGFGGLMGGAVNMGSAGESFMKRGIVSALTGSVTGGFTAGFLGGDIRQGMRNGAFGVAAGFAANETYQYLHARSVETKAIQKELGLTKKEIQQLKKYGFGKINTTEYPDMDHTKWEKLKSLKSKSIDESRFPFNLRRKDIDMDAIIKSNGLHIRNSTDVMIQGDAYRLNLLDGDLIPKHYFNIHYDRFDVVMFPVTHLLFDSVYQWFLGVK